MSRWSETWGSPAWAYNMRTLIYGSAIILVPLAWVFIWWVKS